MRRDELRDTFKSTNFNSYNGIRIKTVLSIFQSIVMGSKSHTRCPFRLRTISFEFGVLIVGNGYFDSSLREFKTASYKVSIVCTKILH